MRRSWFMTSESCVISRAIDRRREHRAEGGVGDGAMSGSR